MTEIVADPLEGLYEKGTLVRPMITAQEQEARSFQTVAATMNFGQDIATAFNAGANTAVNIYKDFQRKSLSGPADPNWDAGDWLDANADRVPQTNQWRFMQTVNQTEAEALLQEYNVSTYEQKLLAARGGFTAFTAQALAGLVDLDAPLALLSGGWAAAGKAGLASTRLGKLALGAAGGGLSNAALATVNYGSDPTADWTSIPAAALLGVGFGAVGGMISPPRAVQANENVIKEFDQYVQDGTPLANQTVAKEFHTEQPMYVTPDGPPRKAAAFTADDLVSTDTGGSTVGAAQINVPNWKAGIDDPQQMETILNATQRIRDMGLSAKREETWDRVESAAPGVARAARAFENVINASPLRSVYERMQQSSSNVAKVLGYDLMVSPLGIATNTKAAALIKHDYENQLRGIGIAPYTDAYNSWAAGQSKGMLERNWSRETKEAFDLQVAMELQARRYDPIYDFRKSDPHVRAAADAHDAFSKRELEISQGRPGEGSVKGWEDLKWEPGYMAQRWSGSKMNRLIASGATTAEKLYTHVANSIIKLHPNILPEDAAIYARAIVQRARTTDRGVNTNLVGILQEDGRDYLREVLLRNGTSEKDIAELIDRLTSRAEQKSQQGQTKSRISVDLRDTDADGVSLLQIIDTNLMDNMARRARGASGRAALARKGIYSPQDRDYLISTILKEQAARKSKGIEPEGIADKLGDAIHNPKDLTDEELRDFFTFFGEGAIGGGISAGYSRAMKLTNLALLNGLGLTQLAETGPLVAAFGWEKFLHYAGDSVKSSLKKGDSELVEELTHMHIMVPEHRLFRDDMTHEFEKGNAQSEFWSTVDHALNQGQRLQGYMSGFYKIKEFQQRIAMTAGADKIMRHILKGDHMTLDRLAEIGLTPAMQARLRKYVDDGTVEFASASPTSATNAKQLYLKKLNLEKWSPTDVEEFTAMLHLITHRQVQRTLAGESSMIFHKDGLMSLFVHLKSFPLIAMTKQAMRHARIADSESIGALMYGLMTAGAVYSAKQAINGNAEDLDAVKVMKGAFGMSNLTGWFPMMTDPLASMLGMDSLKFNEYSRGIDGNVITMPAAFPTLNKMANLPAALASPITGSLGIGKGIWNDNDINALKSTPIMGNYYGMTALLNAIKVERKEAVKADPLAKLKASAPKAAPALPKPIEALLN